MKSQIKKLCSFTLAAALVLSITGFCVKALADEVSDTRTVTGKVTAISGTKVTLEVREMPEDGHPETPGNGQTPPEMPEDSDSATPPEKPTDGQVPSGNGQTPPEKPADGQTPSGNGQTPPEKPTDGQAPSGNGQAAPEKPQGSGQQPDGNSPAKPDDDQEPPEGDDQAVETLTVDLSGASVDMSSLKIGDMLTVELSGSKALSACVTTPPEKSLGKASGSNA